ncbi:FtsK/SpoIIIE domain-containing protein [Cellulomonas sp. PhB150]|uniref:FtsK/SpoIIIE domain-containing protein n=1 Tax=Cellulomonas sp. PhB150 TaxID=2485188 RepID=UPI000F4AD60D|nr:FtsK/SpoIIIE domain-containing protein [Cellulomonas sp. PhB150]ROS26163.1 S-DNA-T family DNA segregation ATPase FtsK/SpoIIIE [Cellulomonas sp. PhB150]
MRTRLTVLRGDEACDVVVTTDADATVGDVADALARAMGQSLGSTLRVVHAGEVDGWALPRGAVAVEVALRAGSVVTLVDPAHDDAVAGARVQVLTGPAAGLDVEVPRGLATLGRGEDSDVVIDDPMVSRSHARVLVGAHVEIVDAGSSNGVVVGGGRVDRAVVGPSDYVLLGDSVLRVTPLAPDDRDDSAVVMFNRSPRLAAAFGARTVEAPTPPEPPTPAKLPLLALVAPLLLGVALFAVMRSTLTLVFLALSPVIMVATFVDRRRGDRRRQREQAAQFAAEVAALDRELDADEERAARLAEMPSTATVVAGARARSPVLWCRRPEHATFLAVRLGVGSAVSRTTVRLPGRGRATTELWSMLTDVRDRHAEVAGVPLVADLRAVGAVGVAGPASNEVARALVVQLAGLHSPAELVIAAVASPSSQVSWEWLAWLPHVESAHSPLGGPHLAAHPAAASVLVTSAEEVVAARGASSGVLPAVLLVVEDDALADRGRLVRLAETGPAVGVHVLWRADVVDRLPAACRAFVAGAADGSWCVGTVADGARVDAAVERVGTDEATDFARGLAAVVDSGAPVIDETDLPRSVGFVALAGAEVAESPAAVLEVWRETGSVLDRDGPPVRRRRDAGLRALVGLGSGGQFVLDLRAQGPHALVGGTTGAGKSELLQAWVLGLATAHSPDRVTFLLVDYKGGAAFADCVDLPHCVGLVTDLSPPLVRRALASLRAELRRREHLFNRKGVKDLLELERSGDPETPPALVIVVDEFAALVAEVPEFVDGVVDVAQRGRSLGLHLILATQRPAGVIKDNLRANTNLRVALRMADEHDSTDVLGSALAAGFDPGLPGRAAVRTGPGRVSMFQSAYPSARSGGAPRRPTVRIESLAFGPAVPWDVAPVVSEPDDDTPTDIARVVATVRAAALDIPPPRRPWLPELPAVVGLEAALDGIVLGIADRPAQQEQHVVCWRPDEDGCLAVLGTGGSGKSTLLRTVAASAAGENAHVYGLDHGSGGLAMLDVLPHVGAVIDGADTERTVRLLRRLRDQLDERATRFAAARAGTLTEYRALAGRPDEPRVLLLVDGLAAFREAYEADAGRTGAWAAFQRIVVEGRPLGIHVAMSAERPGALPTSLSGSVQRRLVLRQADESAYGVLGIPKDVLGPASPPGRGVFSGEVDELQVAVPGAAASPAEQARALVALAARVRRDRPPEAVRRLPTFVAQADLPVEVDGLPVLGVADDTLQPLGFTPRGTFVLAGLPGSGRTTALGAIAEALRRWSPGTPRYYVGNRRSPVHAAAGWTDVALDADDAAALARAILPSLSRPDRLVVIIVEGLGDFLGGPAEQPLTDVVRAARRGDHLVVAEAETSAWGSSWPLVADVRAGRRGLVLQPDSLDGDALFRTAFPRIARAEFPPGRGVYVEAGRQHRVQVAVPG